MTIKNVRDGLNGLKIEFVENSYNQQMGVAYYKILGKIADDITNTPGLVRVKDSIYIWLSKEEVAN